MVEDIIKFLLMVLLQILSICASNLDYNDNILDIQWKIGIRIRLLNKYIKI